MKPSGAVGIYATNLACVALVILTGNAVLSVKIAENGCGGSVGVYRNSSVEHFRAADATVNVEEDMRAFKSALLNAGVLVPILIALPFVAFYLMQFRVVRLVVRHVAWWTRVHLLKIRTQDVRVVIISGLPGTGKTTLAKYLGGIRCEADALKVIASQLAEMDVRYNRDSKCLVYSRLVGNEQTEEMECEIKNPHLDAYGRFSCDIVAGGGLVKRVTENENDKEYRAVFGKGREHVGRMNPISHYLCRVKFQHVLDYTTKRAIVSNTSLKKWEVKPYQNDQTNFVHIQMGEAAKFTEEQIEYLAKCNAHGVDIGTLRFMVGGLRESMAQTNWNGVHDNAIVLSPYGF